MALRLNADFPVSNQQAAFRAAYYQPSFSKYNGTTVPGVQWLSERTTGVYDIFQSGTQMLCAVRDLASPPEAFEWDGVWFGHPGSELIDQYAGTPLYRTMLNDRTLSAETIVEFFAKDVEMFMETRQAFLLY